MFLGVSCILRLAINICWLEYSQNIIYTQFTKFIFVKKKHNLHIRNDLSIIYFCFNERYYKILQLWNELYCIHISITK